MQAAHNLVPAYDDFAELWRPCLRHVELEVDYELVDEDFARLGEERPRVLALEVDLVVLDDADDPNLASGWFAKREPDVDRAVSTVSLRGLGAVDDDDGYLPGPRSYRVPIAVGVGIAAAAAVLAAL